MSSLLIYILCLLTLHVDSKDDIVVRGKVKIILESVQTDCDHNFVEYFHRSPQHEMLYTFRVVKTAPDFSIKLIMRALGSQRILYRLNNLDGCQFISNPLMNKVLAHTYNAIIVNNSFKGCPIPPKVYYLKNMDTAHLIPLFHPAGRFQVNLRILMSQSSAPFVMEIIWKYNVIRL